jgi:hypothetical protein
MKLTTNHPELPESYLAIPSDIFQCRIQRFLYTGLYFFWKDMAPRSSIRGTSLKLYPQRARTQLRKYSFAMRVAKYWNSLPEKIVIRFSSI